MLFLNFGLAFDIGTVDMGKCIASVGCDIVGGAVVASMGCVFIILL